MIATWYHRPYVLWLIAVIHIQQGILCMLEPMVTGVTSMALLSRISGSPTLTGLVVAVVGISALAGSMSFRLPTFKGWLLIVPQQIVVLLEAISSVTAILAGHYADGVPRPAQFIWADQAFWPTALVIHSISMWQNYVRIEVPQWNGR